jgi:flagellar motor switch/type III secretory pathway protein FliN
VSELDAAELEAIQAAMRGTTSARPGVSQPEDVEATQLALIADDRVAEAARPILSNAVGRWAKDALKTLVSHIPGAWRLDVVSGEVIDGPTAKEEMRGAWVCALGGPATPGGEHGDHDLELVLGVQGGAIDAAVARRCGGGVADNGTGRAASQMMLRLFKPAGQAIASTLAGKLKELLERPISESSDPAIVTRLVEARGVIRVAVVFGGDISGQINIYARPETLVPTPPALPAERGNAAAIANAMANVPVELVVELGSVQIPLSALRTLDPSVVHALPGFIDSRVPLYCGGALKAWVRPVVTRGVLAVEVISVVHDQGITQ